MPPNATHSKPRVNESATYVIAEAASTHDGEMRKALELIGIAAEAGADCCKFQFWSDPDRLADRRNVGEAYREIYQRYQVPAWWLKHLRDECHANGIDFICTTFLPEDIERLDPFVDVWKVASFEAGDYEFLEAHEDRPVMLSTGMMDMGQVAESLIHVENPDSVLHCVSSYPCGPTDLTVIGEMRKALRLPIGFSDHCADTLSGPLAVAAGAEVLEVHFRHPATEHFNPDLAPAVPDLAEYVRLVRRAELYRGEGFKCLLPDERKMAAYRVRSPSI